MRIQRIVVGIDGSVESEAALDLAVTVAEPADAEIVAVHALGLLERMGGTAPVASASHRDEIQFLFESEWCRRLASSAVRSRRILRDGPPVLALMGVVEEEKPDLVVVGSRGRGRAAQQLLGSTSSQLVAQCPCPVTVVPAPAGSST